MVWRRVTETEHMPSLVCGNTEHAGGGKSKNCNKFGNRTTEPAPSLITMLDRGHVRSIGARDIFGTQRRLNSVFLAIFRRVLLLSN
jgi:hypothetical protein